MSTKGKEGKVDQNTGDFVPLGIQSLCKEPMKLVLPVTVCIPLGLFSFCHVLSICS